jgi:hypothetical protein
MQSTPLRRRTFSVGTSENFWTVFGGDFPRRFQQGIGAAISTSEADKSEPNKSNAFGALLASLTLAQIEDVFLPPILTFMAETFSIILSPEFPDLNILIGFRALARANSCTEV